MTMEYKRTAGWQAAAKSRGAHSLGVSELRSAFTQRLSRLPPEPRIFRLHYSSRSLANRGEIAACSGSLLPSNQPPFAGFSNREHYLLELLLSCRKQTTAPRSNRELSTDPRCFSYRKTGPQRSAFSALPNGPRGSVLPFLPSSASRVECDVTSSKQRTEEFLPGATT